MNIMEWFDPENIDHLKAYKHLMDTGMWPEGFIPDNIEIPVSWNTHLVYKMANLWVMNKLNP